MTTVEVFASDPEQAQGRIEAASFGTIVEVNPGMYDLSGLTRPTINTPDGVSLYGEDWQTTIITSDAALDDYGTTVRAPSYALVRDLQLANTLDGPGARGGSYGANASAAVTPQVLPVGSTGLRLMVVGRSDAVYVCAPSASPASLRVVNSYLRSVWDTLMVRLDNTADQWDSASIEFNNVHSLVQGPDTTDSPLRGVSVINGNLTMFGGSSMTMTTEPELPSTFSAMAALGNSNVYVKGATLRAFATQAQID